MTAPGAPRPQDDQPVVVEDLGIFLGAGRQTRPIDVVDQALDAERLGLRRGFVSERYDIKLAGPLLGAAAALTSRLELGTGILAAGAYHPVMAAATGATLQAAFGERFVLGLGRGSFTWYEVFGIAAEPGPLGKQASLQAFEDYIGIIRRLWRGETVSYDGPAGRYDSIFLADPPQCEPPPIWSGIFGGEKAARLAARAADGALILDMITPEAVSRAVAWIRDERERLGLDGPFRIAACTVSTPGFDEIATLNQTSARFLTYVVGIPEARRAFARINGWDDDVMKQFAGHPVFGSLQRRTADLAFHRHQLVEASRQVPITWMRDSCAIGSTEECVAKIAEFREAGADEVVLYGSTPADNADVIAAWRGRGLVQISPS
ncbi:MAG: TIGR03857 family LLM class F420-dependent oxidoreductase [Solirubrobacteraceae bacterium]